MKPMHLYQQLDLLSRKLRQLEQKSENKGLSAAKLTVLQMIKLHNPSTLKELANRQKVALPTMSKMVDDLQKRGLIIRALSKEDARQRWIVPTQKGILSLKQAEIDNESFWKEKVTDVSQTELTQLSKSLDILLKIL